MWRGRGGQIGECVCVCGGRGGQIGDHTSGTAYCTGMRAFWNSMYLEKGTSSYYLPELTSRRPEEAPQCDRRVLSGNLQQESSAGGVQCNDATCDVQQTRAFGRSDIPSCHASHPQSQNNVKSTHQGNVLYRRATTCHRTADHKGRHRI